MFVHRCISLRHGSKNVLQRASFFASHHVNPRLFSRLQSTSATVNQDVHPPLPQAHPQLVKRLFDQIFPYSEIDAATPIASDDRTLKLLFDQLQNYFLSNQQLSIDLVLEILDAAVTYHRKLPNVLTLSRPKLPESSTCGQITICGDTHGQFPDVCEIFRDSVAGIPSSTNHFLFNGDIVDRGAMGLEIFLYLLSLQLHSPPVIHILRGNHESQSMTEGFGFRKELQRKYPKDWQLLMNHFNSLFQSLPLGAVIEKDFFVLHGGLGPATYQLSIDEINQINRFQEPEHDLRLLELLWSDPTDTTHSFAKNARGGGTYRFGQNVTMHFLNRNQLRAIIRSHEVKDEGYEIHHEGRCITVFSAPNYCGVCKNKGAVIRLSGSDPQDYKVELVQFTERKKPVARTSSFW